jgi:hypothetical protein
MRKIGKLLFVPVMGMLAFTISCNNTSDPNTPVAIYGCMDPQSTNYNPKATIDDKSCQYATTSEQGANAVIELYTGVRAKHGPEAMTLAKNIQTSSPDKVIIISIHAGPQAIAKINWPDYTSAYGQAIADSAGMNYVLSSYPGGSVNRYHYTDVPTVSVKKMVSGDAYTALYKDGFLPAANYWMGKVSPVNIGLATYWTESSRKLKVLVELYYKSLETVPNYLNVALLENGLTGKQISLNDTLTNYVQDHVLRTFLTGQWGELITGTTGGARIKKIYELTVPAGYVIENCDVVAFVCEEVNGRKVNILTGKQKKAKI